jgi:hypothetical protein
VAITPRAVRERNQFHWAPIIEVAKLFAAIFVTIFPVLAILAAGRTARSDRWSIVSTTVTASFATT